MITTTILYYSFPNNRIRINEGTNIKDISSEASINRRCEEYSIQAFYTIKDEGSFIKYIESQMKNIRGNPSIIKCVFKCSLVPNRQIILGEEFNKKLTDAHIKKLAREICQRARRRFKNPNAFNE